MSEQLDKWKCLRCDEEFEHAQSARPIVCPNPNCGRKGAFEALTGPFRFFKGKKFVPKLLADAITATRRFATHRQSHVMWAYGNGSYAADGEEVIRAEVREALGTEAKEGYVNEVVAHICETTYTLPEKFSPSLNLVNLKNGILDIETGELAPHSPDLIFTSELSVEFNPEAECPKIGKFLREVLPETDIPAFIEAIGFCLYRNYFIRKAVVLLGEGGNGKSTLLRLVELFLGGQNTSHIAVQELSGRFAPARLFGKLANIYADLPTYAWRDTGRFKMLTGRDTIDADVKFKNRFSFVNHAKMFFSANRLPETSDETEAFFERLLIITCPNKFDGAKRNPNILNDICTPEELSGLLNAVLAGLRCLRETGGFLNPKSFEEIHDTYIRKSNPIAAFANDCLGYDANNAERKDEIYEAYVQYCQRHSLPAVDKSVFGRKLPSHVTVTDTQITTKDGRKHAYLGIKLKAEEPKSETTIETARLEQSAHPISNYYNSNLRKVKIILNNEELPVHSAHPVHPPVDTVSDLKKRLFNEFGVNPFKPSEIPKHFPDNELARLTAVMDDMMKRGDLITVPLESGEVALRLVPK